MGKKQTQPKPDDMPDISSVAKVARIRQFKNLLEKIKSGKATASDMKTFSYLEAELSKQDTQGKNVVYSTGEVAKAMRRTERTVRDWIKSGMPVLPGGGYDLDAIQEWKNGKKKKHQADDDKDAEYWQTQYRKNKAKLSEIQLKLQKGELLPKADVISAFREMQTYVKKHLQLIPRIAPDRMTGLEPQEQKALLTELVETILTGMARGESAEQIKRVITS